MPADLHLTMEDLEAFLQENTDRIVGQPNASNRCPIACYFKRKRDLNVIIDNGFIGIDPAYRLPDCTIEDRHTEPWEDSFILNLDQDFEDHEFVYGSDALIVFEEIREWHVND